MNGNVPSNIHFPRAVQRRAAAACLRCRSRKVRCDLLQHGAPCTNCGLDRLECTVSTSRRHKQNSTGTLDLLSQSELVSSDGQNHGSQMIYQITNLPASLTDGEQADAAKIPTSKSPVDQSSSISGGYDGEIAVGKSQIQFKPPPSIMVADDIQYLKMKGAFTVPSAEFRKQLLQCYLDYVQPYNPILDIEDLLAMAGQVETTGVSYLLFQAVMLGGSLFVESNHLMNGGYATRRLARQAFHKRARILYECDYEQDTFCIAQALLLMSLWYETPNDHRDCWYWSGLAIGLTQVIHFDKICDVLPFRKKLLGKRKRLWWSAFVRDRLIALGMKLPTRLAIEENRVKALDLDDFNIDESSPNFMQPLENHQLLWDVEKQRQLSIMDLEMVRLCICIDQIIRAQREANFESKSRQLQQCDEKLGVWLSNLSPEAKFDLKTDLGTDRTTAVHQATLQMIYLCAFAFLQRSCLTLSIPSSQLGSFKAFQAQEISRGNLRSAADMMSEIAKKLRTHNLIRYLPHYAVISFIHVNLMYLIDLTSVNKVDGISQSMRSMAVFQDSYFDTDYGTRLVNSVFERESESAPLDFELQNATEVSMPLTMLPDSPFLDLPSNEWIVEELASFINSSDSELNTMWQFENSDLELSAQLETHQPSISFSTSAAEASQIETAKSFENDRVSVSQISDRNNHNASSEIQDRNEMEPSMDWLVGDWPSEPRSVESTAVDLDSDFTMGF